MAKDTAHEPRVDELTDQEIERIEGALFCLGGPPRVLTAALLQRSSAVARKAVGPAIG